MFGLLIQEFKTLLKSPASISILIIPLVLLVGLGYLLPSGWIVPSSITIGIVGAVLLYFGGSIEEIKRTSFMKSISLTRLSKFSFLATKILFSIFVSMIAVLWVLFFSWVFTSIDAVAFLATDFSNLLPESDDWTKFVRVIPFDIDWQRVKWAQMIYAGIITIVIAVSLSFVFVAFAKSSLSFYLMSFGYLLAMILFGGVVMPGFLISSDNSWFKDLYYLVPNFYTNNVMAQAFSGGVGNSLLSSVGSLLNELADNISEIPDGEIESFFMELSSKSGEEFYNWLNSHVESPFINIGTKGQLIKAWEGESGLWVGTLDALFEGKGLGTKLLNIGGISGLVEKLAPYMDTIVIDVLPIAIKIFVEIFPAIGDNIINVISNAYPEAGDALAGMFAVPDPYNWFVPWIETGIFLGIAVTFFKWS